MICSVCSDSAEAAGVHKLVKAEFQKGGNSLTFGPTKKVITVLQDLDIAYDPKTKFQALQYRQREKKKHVQLWVDKGSASTYGGLSQYLRQHEKSAIQERMKTHGQEFSDNTPYILSGWVVDSENDHVIVVHTTENLILNAYRHHRVTSGGPFVVAMDHTYR
jgi:hypothetical protein